MSDPRHQEIDVLRDLARRHRMRRATLQLRWAGQFLPAGSELAWELRRHAMRFGINMHWWQRTEPAVQDRCRLAAARLFNAATIPCYWGQSMYSRLPPFEPRRGETRIDEMLDAGRWCRAHGIRPKGHPLIFFREPAWVGALPPAEQDAAYWAHIRDTVGLCRGVIDDWEVVNEPTIGFTKAVEFNAPGMAGLALRHGVVGVIAKAHEAALRANPDAQLIQNDWLETEQYAAICRQAIDAHIQIDAIGLQHHATEELVPPEALRASLDRFCSLGRPIHITEIMIPSGAAEHRTRGFQYLREYVTTPDGEARQAMEAELLYRRLFAHPSVQAITWWDLSDAFSCQDIPDGLLRADGSPKAAYQALDRLINDEWRSRGKTALKQDGTADVEGYAGEYSVQVACNGRSLHGTFSLSDKPPASVIVELSQPKDGSS
jgi:GH35 family endo-1,4-beta-xylanase